MRGRVVGVACALACAVSSRGARGQPSLAVTGPASVAGDGATAISLELVGATDATDRVVIDASGGLVGAITHDGASTRIAYVPPRVASDTEVTITATLGRLRASARLVVTPPLVATPRAGGTGPLRLSVPDRLVLGRDTHAEITLVPPRGTAVRVVASIGAVGPTTIDAAGTMHVPYTPPQQRAPGRALIGAITEDGTIADLAVIALHGIGQVDARSRPHQHVTVRVGADVFGPFRANARGRARMTVVAAPGIAVATATALGGRESTMPLPAAPVSRVAIACIADRVIGFAIDDAGEPLANAEPVFTVAGGAAAPVERVAPGVFATRALPPHDAPAGTTLATTAALPGDAASTTRCDAVISGEAPVGWTIRVDRAAIRAGESVALTATPRYPGRGPRVRVDPALVVDRGTLTDRAIADDGTVTARWTIEQVDGARAASATAGSEPEAAPARVAVTAGPIARIAIDPPDRRPTADGRDTEPLVVRAWDRFGNPAPIVGVRFAARGRVTVLAGRARYRAPLAFVASTDDIVVRDPASGVTAAIQIPLVPARRTFSTGVRAGMVANPGGRSIPAAAIDGGARLPFAGRRIAVGAELGWYGTTYPIASSEPVELSLTAIPVLARATYGVELGRASIYGGFAGGILVSRARTESVSTGMRVQWSTSVAVAGLVGMDLRVGGGRAVIETAYAHASVGGDVVRGQLGGIQLTAGYRIER